MDLLGIRAFSTELLKIAVELQDADVRALLAERQGKEYLQGGRLRSNAAEDTNWQPKLAFNPITVAGIGAPHTYDFSSKKKSKKTKAPEGSSGGEAKSLYQRGRDYVVSGLKGGLTGASATGLYHGLKGTTVETGKSMIPRGHLRAAAGIGAAVAMGDKAFRRHQEKQLIRALAGKEKKANLPTSFSPGREMHRTGEIGHFENKIHVNQPAKAPGLMGKAGRLPR